MWILQQSDLLTRQDLIEMTGLSQPSVTRIIQILMEAGLVEERQDLINPSGPGRPTIPLDLAPAPWAHAAVVVDSRYSYITLYDTHLDVINEEFIDYNVAEVDFPMFLAAVRDTLRDQVKAAKLPLSNIGLIITGRVTDGQVYNPEWNWHGVNVAGMLSRSFKVPVSVESLAVGNVLTEFLRHRECVVSPGNSYDVGTLSAGDTVIAAWTSPGAVRSTHFIEYPGSEILGTEGVNLEQELCTGAFVEIAKRHGCEVSSVPELVELAESSADNANTARTLLDERARVFGTIAAEMSLELELKLISLTGRAFSQDPRARFIAADTIAKLAPSVRVKHSASLIRPHHDAAAAIAVYSLFANPAAIAKRMDTGCTPGTLRRSWSRN